MVQFKNYKWAPILTVFFFISTSITPPHALSHPHSWLDGAYTAGNTTANSNVKNTQLANNPINNSCGLGDPVLVPTGEFYYECTDLVIPGRGMDVVIKHIYRSGKNVKGMFGHGWSINYHERLKELSSGNVEIIRGNGRSDQFVYNGSGYDSPKGFFEQLVLNGDGSWTLTKAHGTKHEYDVDGKLTEIEDRNGNSITFTYDAGGLLAYKGKSLLSPTPSTVIVLGYDYRLTKITDTVGRDITLTYDTNGRLDKIKDFEDREIIMTYDSTSDNLTSIRKPTSTEYPSGVKKEFFYDSNHNITSIKDEKGQTFVTNRYDSEGRVYEQDLGSGTFEFDYSVANEVTVTDRKGHDTTYTFNAAGNVTKKEEFTSGLRTGEPASFITEYEYNDDLLVTSMTMPRNNGVLYTYDSNNANPRARGNILQVRRKSSMDQPDDINDLITNTTYESSFNFPKTITDPLGNAYTYTYDYELLPADPDYGTNGNLVKIEQPAISASTPEISLSYNANGQVTKITDPNDNVTEYTYFTANGYLKEIKRDPSGINAVAAFTYDAVGNVASATDPELNVTEYDYNELNWLIKETSPLDYETKYTYDKNGNVTKIENQLTVSGTVWQETDFTYDTLNNVKTIEDPLNRVTTYNYDLSENVSSIVDAESNTTTFEYDERDKLFKVKDANTPQGITVYDYDLNGNLSKITDAESNETAYTYDLFDRQTRITYDDASVDEFKYDKNSNLTENITPKGDSITFNYDALNRLTDKDYESDTNLDVDYTYDIGSRLTALDTTASEIDFTYDDLNRVTSTTQRVDATNYTIDYTYDKNGNRTQIEYPSTKTVDYTYDDHDRVSLITVDSTDLVEYEYDFLDRRTKKTYVAASPDQETEYTYNLANELTDLDNTTLTSTNISSYVYTYDDVSNRLSKQRTYTSNSAETHSYTYNDIYELTGVSNAQSHSYAYDNVGNRTTVDSVSYTSNGLNQYSQVGATNYTYDSNGNLTDNGPDTFTYDEQNRLIEFDDGSTTTDYEYDGLDRRTYKKVGTAETYFIYDGDEVIAEYNGSGALQAEYVTGVGIDEVLTMDRSSTTYYYHYDGLGNVTEVTNSSGTIQENYTYDPYGTPSVTSSSIDNPYRFTGRRFDEESGVYYYRARQYDPSIGRFLQRDPLGYADSTNIFKYVHNNPVNFVDPTGEAWWIVAIEAGFFGYDTYGLIKTELDPCATGLEKSIVRAAWVAGALSLGGGAVAASRKVTKYRGGAFDDLATGGDLERHHMPADSVSPVPRKKGPAVSMDKGDHWNTASWGSSAEAKAYRKAQQKLIEAGKFKEAQRMDIFDLQNKFGSKYNKAIKEMIDYTNSNF